MISVRRVAKRIQRKKLFGHTARTECIVRALSIVRRHESGTAGRLSSQHMHDRPRTHWGLTSWELFALLFGAPVDEVAGVEGDAKKISGDKSELGGADTDDTDNGAIDGGNDPALPESLANEHGGENGQNAREIIESNHVEDI